MSPVPDGSATAVVKIGGSLIGTPRLGRLIDAIVATRRISSVLVPGGGPFAELVRTMQAGVGFGDRLAHRLAIDAMGQFGAILADRNPALSLVADRDGIAAAHRARRVPVWSAAEVRNGHKDIPESWDVTSDSLALWLAISLGAERLLLVKSVDADAAGGPVQWARANIVDAAFPDFASRFSGEIVIAGPSCDDVLSRLLTGGPGSARTDAAA